MNFETLDYTDNHFHLNVFENNDVKRIHQGTLRILESTGVIADDEETMKLFSKAGAMVDFEKHIVRIPKELVENAIKSSPSRVLLAGRGDKGFYIGDGKVRFCSFGEAPQIIDPITKEIRNVTIRDIEDYAKIVDALPEHDMCWDAWVSMDVPAETYSLYSLEAYFNNTEKPVCAATPNGILAQAVVEMAVAVAGSEESLRERSVCIAGTCPKSPLHLDKGICESVIVLARAGIPNMNMSALTAGGTGPVTLAGTIVVHNAEMLACLVLSQLAAKGAPYVYGACTTALDLRRGNATYGCPEIGMFSAALSKMAAYYKLPHVVAGFWTDSKTTDLQCGHEKTMNGIIPALAGADMIFGTGCLAAGMIGSLGQLVADDEMIAMVRRTLKGIPTEDIDLALDLIESVGPQGNFLAEEHTVINMKTSQVYPKLIDRNMYHEWAAAGRKTFIDRADEKAIEILQNHTPKQLPESVQQKLKEIIAKTEKDLGIR